jgi:hypothetical protein
VNSMTADTEPVTTGGSPEAYQVTVTLPSLAAQVSFRDWLASGAACNAFWHWCGANGRHV